MQGEIKIIDLIKNSFIHSTGLIINKILNLAVKIISLKVLGLETLGIYTLLTLIVPYYSYFFMGISYSLPRKIVSLQSKNKDREIYENRSVVNLFSLFISILLISIFTGYMMFIYDEKNSDFTKMNLVLVFLTAIISEFTTLLNAHLKSIGSFGKIHKNAALVRVFSPIFSIILIYQLGLNGLLLSALLVSIFSAIDLIIFSLKNKTGVLAIGYFNRTILLNNIKLGISMLFSKKLPDIMYTIFLTFLGFSFKKEVLGAFNFFGTMFGFTSQLLGAFYTIVERRIYIGKERLKSNIDYLLNLAFGNSVTFGIIMISLIILILNLIPIYFTELTDYINLIPFILLIFTIRNSIMISEYYINSYNLFFKRNIIAVILSSIYLLILNITNFKSIESFIITHVGVLIFYKIVIILFLKEFLQIKFQL